MEILDTNYLLVCCCLHVNFAIVVKLIFIFNIAVLLGSQVTNKRPACMALYGFEMQSFQDMIFVYKETHWQIFLFARRLYI